MTNKQKDARLRAEVIMKVRTGLMTATEAAKQLGVSRKTYYKWEKRFLKAMMNSLTEKNSGRKTTEVEQGKEGMKKRILKLEEPNNLLMDSIKVRGLLNENTGRWKYVRIEDADKKKGRAGEGS